MKTTRFLNMMAASLVGVAFMSCSSQDDVLTPAGQTYTMSVTAQKGGDGTRALSLSGEGDKTLNATWTAGDEVEVWTADGTTKKYGTLTAQSDGATTTLSGSLDELPSNDETLTLKYLSPSYSQQDGTLTGTANSIDKVCDYATATVTATVSGTNVTTGAAEFQNQQAVVKFTLKDKDGNALPSNPTAFTMTDGTSTVELTNIPAETYTTNGGDGVLYVAFPASNVSADITLTATVGTDTYTCTASSKSFTNGKYYGVTAKMAKQAAAPEGAISGKFSVSANKQVYFSKGNLRYASGTWSFFDNQYDYYTSYSADAWDKFGWSTSATTYGMNTSTSSGTYSGDFADWGSNAISNGGNAANSGWFTLSSDEWTYLFNTRTNAASKYGYATVAGKVGIIIVPDDFTDPMKNNGSGAFVGSTTTGFDANVYTEGDNWNAMQSAGCVFLPAAGWRNGTAVSDAGSNGYYWSSTASGTGSAYRVYFRSNTVGVSYGINRRSGYSVRLVKDVAAPAPAPEEEFVTFSDGTNTVKVATKNLGATTVAESAATCYGDYYAWGATETFGNVSYTAYNAGTVTATKTGGYSQDNAPYYNGSAYTKYTGTSSATLEAADDAVAANMPGWHMPTQAEFQTLYAACGGTGTSMTPSSISSGAAYAKGIYWVTGGDAEVTIGSDTYKVNGVLFVQDADTHVFFPAAGYIYDTNLKNAGSFSYYRSSSLDTSSAYYAYILFFGSAAVNPATFSYRDYGYSVRPFKD